MHIGIPMAAISFLSIFFVSIMHPVFSTGDAGGLITASHLLGVAHPPGYPLYVELGKLFSLLPLGNIGFRLGLLSVIPAVVSLSVLFRIAGELEEPVVSRFGVRTWKYRGMAGMIAVLSLGLSYSFCFQTSMIKFYPLNTIVVSVLLFISLRIACSDKNLEKWLCIAAFILGLATGLHHTGLLMSIPLALAACFSWKRSFRFIHVAGLFFLMGFSVNAHLVVRSLRNAFVAAHKADTLENFINLLLRRFYGSASSIESVSYAFHSFDGYLYALKNLFFLFDSNFGAVTLPLALVGIVAIFMSNRKIGFVSLLAFLLYTVILGKMTFAGQERNVGTMYVVGNQYFIPALLLYAMFMGLGTSTIIHWASKIGWSLLARTLPVVFCVYFLSFIPMRFLQVFQYYNWVPYYHGKDLLSVLPTASVVSTFGDNHTFELWYMKLVARYRDDVCHITSHYYDDLNWRLEGCRPKEFYRKLIPEFLEGNFAEVMKERRFYSTVTLSSAHPLSSVVEVKPYGFAFMYLPKDGWDAGEIEHYLTERHHKMGIFLTPEICLTHRTDDPFTFEMCRFFSDAYLVMASHINPEKVYGTITVDASVSYGKFLAPLKFSIKVGIENSQLIDLYRRIRTYNDYKRCFLLESPPKEGEIVE